MGNLACSSERGKFSLDMTSTYQGRLPWLISSSLKSLYNSAHFGVFQALDGPSVCAVEVSGREAGAAALLSGRDGEGCGLVIPLVEIN